MGKHSAERRSPLSLILVTAAVLGIAVAAFLVVRLFNGSPGSSSAASAASAPASAGGSTTAATSSSASTTTPSATSTTSAADAAALAALTSCVDRQGPANRLLDTISSGAGHWSDHVQGQTDIDSATRTLVDVKTTVWGPTRAAGPGDVAAYQAAQAAFTAAPGCPVAVGQMPAPTDVAPRLQACTAHEQALDAVAASGALVMGDWGTHLSEMGDHAAGRVNSAQAQANWLKRWAEAPAHLEPYRVAVAALASAPACTA